MIRQDKSTLPRPFITFDLCEVISPFPLITAKSVAVKGLEWRGYLRVDMLINSAVPRSRRHLAHRGHVEVLQLDRCGVRARAQSRARRSLGTSRQQVQLNVPRF